jgi:hypothetical protein
MTMASGDAQDETEGDLLLEKQGGRILNDFWFVSNSRARSQDRPTLRRQATNLA